MSLAKIEWEVRETYPKDPVAQRRYIRERTGIITKQDLEDMKADFLKKNKPPLLQRIKKFLTSN